MIYRMSVPITSKISVGQGHPLLIIAGPCVIESEQLLMDVAGQMKEWTDELTLPYVFKASFDKANRTSVNSFRGLGMEKGLELLTSVEKLLGLPLLTDVHDVSQVKPVAEVVDILQIPAFLCRQTDLLIAAGKTGKVVNVKKGQFLSPQEMKNIIEKIESVGSKMILLTERGTTFGYNNLVVDMRSLPIMRSFGYPVIFDATHSVQQPGGMGSATGGDRQFIPYLARSAVAVGCDGVFLETHPNPEKAKSDGPNMIPLSEVYSLLEQLKELHDLTARQMISNRGKKKLETDTVIIHTDGCSKGNPGEAGIGIVFSDGAGESFHKIYKYIGETTNNVAEYTALITALEEAQKQGFKKIAILSDSELMVKQVNGQYKVKDANLKNLNKRVQELWQHFDTATIQHIPREKNEEADSLSNLALDNK